MTSHTESNKCLTIELEGMQFRSFHGCQDAEKLIGNLFVVDFKGVLPPSGTLAEDSLDNTVDYGEVYDIVSREMASPSNLLENVAGRIFTAIENRFPQFENMCVRVSKRRPPVGGVCDWARISLEK